MHGPNYIKTLSARTPIAPLVRIVPYLKMSQWCLNGVHNSALKLFLAHSACQEYKQFTFCVILEPVCHRLLSSHWYQSLLSD